MTTTSNGAVESSPQRSAGSNGDSSWHTTACILCSVNCGHRGPYRRAAASRASAATRRTRRRGATRARRHSGSTTTRTRRHRLTTPLRRRADGTFEPIDWDTRSARSPRGCADSRHPRRRHDLLLRRRRAGQSPARRPRARDARRRSAACSRRTRSAQEKTGEFWVDGKLFGRPRCHTAGLRARGGRRVPGQESLAVARLPSRPRRAARDRDGSARARWS